MEEMKMVVQKYISITRSFSNKVMPENFGIEGHRFSPKDFFASYNGEIEVEKATPEAMAELSNKLYELAKADVERSIIDYIRQLRGGEDTDSVNAKELDEIAVYISKIYGGEDPNAVEKEIAAVKDKLSESQKNMLRKLVVAAKNKLA